MGKTRLKGNKRKPLFGKKSVHQSEEAVLSDRSDIIARRQRFLNQLIAFVQHHPVLVWGGSWVVLMALCWLSITGLLHVDTFEIVEPPQTELVATEPEIPQLKPRVPAKPASSFGLLAAIAVSCGATSLLIAKQLTPKKSQRGLVIKRPNPVSVEIATPESDLARQAPAEVVTRRSSPVAMQPTVTVLSPEENHPLDWGEAGLADLMDIRKQKSFSNYS